MQRLLPLFLVALTSSVVFAEETEEKDELEWKAYYVTAFDPERPKVGTEGGDHHIYLLDDYSETGEALRKVFMEAIGQLAMRDNAKSDEPRKVNFIHFDTRNDTSTEVYLEWLKELKETKIPDVVYRSQDRY